MQMESMGPSAFLCTKTCLLLICSFYIYMFLRKKCIFKKKNQTFIKCVEFMSDRHICPVSDPPHLCCFVQDDHKGSTWKTSKPSKARKEIFKWRLSFAFLREVCIWQFKNNHTGLAVHQEDFFLKDENTHFALICLHDGLDVRERDIFC